MKIYFSSGDKSIKNRVETRANFKFNVLHLYQLMKHELQSIISGENKIGDGAIIQTAACYLKAGAPAGGAVKGTKQYKAQETEILKRFIDRNKL